MVHTKSTLLIACKDKGLDFLEECYDTEHTLSLDTALDDIDAICRRNSEVMA